MSRAILLINYPKIIPNAEFPSGSITVYIDMSIYLYRTSISYLSVIIRLDDPTTDKEGRRPGKCASTCLPPLASRDYPDRPRHNH